MTNSLYLVIFCCFVAVSHAEDYSSDHFDVIINDSIRLDCASPANTGNQWRYNGERLYLGHNFVGQDFAREVNLTSNYSLIIYEVAIRHEGIFVCIRNSVDVEKYKVIVHVPPTLSLSADGLDTDEIHIEMLSTSSIQCDAMGARPRVELEFFVNDHVSPEPGIQISAVNHTNGFWDVGAVLEFRPMGDRGNISCRSKDNSTGFEQRKTVSFYTYVAPELAILYDNVDITGSTVVVRDRDEHKITCLARAARPPVDLKVEIDGTVHPHLGISTIIQDTKAYNYTTFQSAIEVDHVVSQDNETVVCIAIGRHTIQDRNITIQLILNEPPTVNIAPEIGFKLLLPIVLSAVLITVVLLAIVVPCLLIRKRRATSNDQSNARLSETSLGMIDSPIPKIEVPDVESPASPDGRNETVFTYEFSLPRLSAFSEPENGLVSTESHQSPPRLDLPDIPVSKVTANEYSPSREAVYYSDLKDNAGFSRLFHRQELCLLMSLKSSKVHNRWTGSIAIPNGMSKCVFVSTVTEHILRSRELQWDIYVKRIMELPEMNCLSKTEGICIDGAQLYLVQEHMTCVTMESHIQSNKQDSLDSPDTGLSSGDVKKWIIDILKGLEMIQSYGLLHPGMSTRKILFTDQKVPKLYDFCLAEDASRKVLMMKEKAACSRNQLAPESLLRNEYSSSSDVWSIAVVIWEMLTGTLPYATDQSATIKRTEPSFRGPWPSAHIGVRNDSVFDCWRVDPSVRPTVRQLRLSFEEIDEFSKSFRKNGDDVSGYVPMKGMSAIPTSENKKSNSL